MFSRAPGATAGLSSRGVGPDHLSFHTVSLRGGGRTPVKLPPHSHSPRNHLAGVRTPKESINPARQETQGRCTGSRQARHQPTYLPPGLSDSSLSHKHHLPGAEPPRLPLAAEHPAHRRPRYLKLPGDPNLRPALRLEVLDLKGFGFRNHLRAFHLFRATPWQRSSFLRPARLRRGAERGSGIKTGPREKRPGPKKGPGGGEVAPRTVAPGARVRQELRAMGYTRSFLCQPILGRAPNGVAPQETHGRLSARLPSSVVTLAKRAL
jgi:hypothetical protein